MKKPFLLLALVCPFLISAASGQISMSAMPSSQTVNAGGTFSIQITLSVTGTTPMNFAGYNLWLETAAANSGLFSITGVTSNVTGFTTPSGAVNFPETLTTSGSTHAGFAQNPHSLGFVDTAGGANAVTSPFSIQIETINFAVAPGTAAGNYSFFTTLAATSGLRASSINDSNGNSFDVNNQGTFAITVIPEPSTTGLLLTAGLGVAVFLYRRPRVVF